MRNESNLIALLEIGLIHFYKRDLLWILASKQTLALIGKNGSSQHNCLMNPWAFTKTKLFILHYL